MNKIKLTAESQIGIAKTFSRYIEKQFNSFDLRFDFRIAIHLYATEDTNLPNGNATGFVDSLLFEARIYDMKKMVFYRVKGRDAIKFEGVSPEVRIFKDGSTMIIVDQPCRIAFWQQMEVSSL